MTRSQCNQHGWDPSKRTSSGTQGQCLETKCCCTLLEIVERAVVIVE